MKVMGMFLAGTRMVSLEFRHVKMSLFLIY